LGSGKHIEGWKSLSGLEQSNPPSLFILWLPITYNLCCQLFRCVSPILSNA
jgi:hypothetical protein